MESYGNQASQHKEAIGKSQYSCITYQENLFLTMTLQDFKSSLTQSHPSPAWSVQLQALWYDGKDQWKQAHDLVDQLDDLASAHVHAYLHRVEGDLWNARYWYNRAKQPEFKGSLEDEWETLVALFLPKAH